MRCCHTRSSLAATLRVAVTLEQCWHRTPGGTASSTLRASAALDDLDGLDVVGVSAWHRHPPEPDWRPGVPVRSLPLPRTALYEAWHRLRRPRVERATGPVDVIWASGYAIPPRSAPLAITLHDLAFVRYPEHFTRRGMRLFTRALDLARREADVVLCPSEATRRACADAGIDEARLRVVPWGIEAVVVGDDDVAAVRKQHGVERPYVMWNGTVEPRKNLPTLLEAWRILGRDDVDLVLVGPPGWDATSGERAAAQPGVRRIGFVPEDDLRALHAGAEVFCYPSLLEGFGLPVLDAMAQGTAVVTSAGTSTAEVAGDAGVLVDPLDAFELAGALGSLLDDDERRRRLSDQGRARAATFTWARTAEELRLAFEEIAS